MPVRRLDKPSQGAPLRLFCLPPAGAGASIFYPLLSLDSAAVEICPVYLPGREDRFHEPPPQSLTTLADQLAACLAPQLDRNYAILGYSMGALLGYELVRRWRRDNLPEPSYYFPLAAGPPHLGLKRGLHQLSDVDFRKQLTEMGGTPPELLANEEAMAIFEPILRNDLKNCEQYEFEPLQPLACTIRAFVSDCDCLVSLEEAHGWQAHTSGNFDLQVLPGQPHVLSREKLTDVVRSILESTA